MASIDIYRIDNHAPEASRPYRVKVDGELWVGEEGEARTFRTLSQAHEAIAREARECER